MVMMVLACRFAAAQEDLPYKKVLTLHTSELTSSDVFHISKQLEKVRGIYFWEYSSIDRSLIVTYENGKIQESSILQYLAGYAINNAVKAENKTSPQQDAVAETRYPAVTSMKLRTTQIMTAPFRYEVAALPVKYGQQLPLPSIDNEPISAMPIQPGHASTYAEHTPESLQTSGNDLAPESENLEKLISIHYLGSQADRKLLLTSGSDTLVITSYEKKTSAEANKGSIAAHHANATKKTGPVKKELLIQTDELTNYDVYRISKQLETLEGVDFWGYHADMQTLLISYESDKISDTGVIFKLIGNIKKDSCLKELTSESFFAFIDKADKLVK